MKILQQRKEKFVMGILIVMCIGILVGRFLVSPRFKKGNEYVSILCTFILIFSMGVMLGKKENFLEELSSLGFSSFLFFLIPAGCSIGVVYFLTKHFMKNDETEPCGKELEE